jgi:RNA polymerase sigma-70 factor (ECF subfamily)
VPFQDSAALDEIPAADDLAAFEEAEYRRHVVQQALGTLGGEFPRTTWRAFREYVLAGRPAEDVAAELGVRVGTVYAAKSRVLSRLRAELDGLLE